MKANKEVDFDIGRVAQDAIASTDDVGVVLRLHGITEARLRHFLDLELVDGRELYVRKPEYFAEALALAVAFGMPLPFAAVCKLLNGMRNRVAHYSEPALSSHRVRDFCDAVDRLVSICPDLSALSTSPAFAAAQANPGAASSRKMFMIGFFAFFGELNKWLLVKQRQLHVAASLHRF